MEARTITRHSIFSGAVNTRTITVPAAEWAALEAGELIQVAMPSASADDREFLITGATPEDWTSMFPDESEDEHDEEEEVAHVRQPFAVDCECEDCVEQRERIALQGWTSIDTSVEDDCPF
jgi:hypothetical protein